MPNVDFTLEDFAKQTQQIVERALINERENTRELVDQSIEQALLKEREFTREMVAGEFLSFWEDNLEPVLQELHNDFDALHKDFHGTKGHLVQLVGQHSKDIMELRARQT